MRQLCMVRDHLRAPVSFPLQSASPPPPRSRAMIVRADKKMRPLQGGFRDMYDKVMIIDCRFDYEYDGGHVESNEWLSVHHVPPHRKDKMEELLYFRGDKSKLRVDNDRVCVIFHCEFSKQR